MFKAAGNDGYKQVLDKIEMKTLAYGKTTLMVEFRLQAGAELPRHSHPHEQTGYLVSGQMKLTIGDAIHTVKPGDSWTIGGDIEHCASAAEDSVAVEVFHPVREDYLP